jgi:glutathione S-transferase
MVGQYRLYAHKNSYAMSTHLLLEELGIDYDVTWFNVHKEEEFPVDFLELNPNARVPVLLTPEGPIYESAATMMVLSEAHGNRFMPTGTGRKRNLALQWLFYLMSSFQPEVLIQFHPERYFPDDSELSNALLKASRRELELLWRVIDDAIGSGPYFLEDEYSICDMLFVMQAIWKENQPGDLSSYPNTIRLMRTAFARPAVQRVMEIHDIVHLSELV